MWIHSRRESSPAGPPVRMKLTAPTPLIGPADLAAWFGVSRDHIYRMRDRGELPQAIRLGHLIRWDPIEVEAWLKRATCGTTSSTGLSTKACP